MDKLKKLIAKGIHDSTGMLCVPETSSDPRPERPFITYNITTIAEGMGKRITLYDPKGDLKRTDKINFNITASFNVYGDEDDAIAVYNHFKLYGYYDLKKEGFVVVSIEDFGNRDYIEVDKVIRRQGFDVILRYEHVIEKEEEQIDGVKIKTGGIIND